MTFCSFFILFSLNILFFVVTSNGTTCDDNRVNGIEKMYREIQCTPIFDTKTQCTKAYDCHIFQKINENPNKCYWNNTEYEIGTQLSNNLTEMHCFASCYCSSSPDSRRSDVNVGQSKFRCANIECPSDLGYNSPPEAGCHYEHKINDCCPSEIICPNKEKTVRQSCTVDDQIILHGKKFEPSNSECSTCVCNDGKVECREINCGHQLLHLNDLANGVGVLFYGEGRCCPIGLVWPNGNEVIRSGSLKRRENDDKKFQCKFGNLTVAIGDEVITSETNDKTKCACLIPPLITCIQEPNSD